MNLSYARLFAILAAVLLLVALVLAVVGSGSKDAVTDFALGGLASLALAHALG